MRIAALTSGGVDSSVALCLLKEEGHEVEAFYCKVWLEDEKDFTFSCPWEEDISYTRALCDQLKIPLNIIPLQGAYYDTIVQYVLDSLKKGETPSPDVLCNGYIKFGAFIQQRGHEFEAVASGHYAQVTQSVKGNYLICSADPVKDQTYFLSALSQAQLQRLCFPLGTFQKKEVRRLATQWKLPSAQRKDSQGLCFLGKISYPDFVGYYLGKKPGKIIEKGSRRILGEHEGYWFYTIGQRQGLGLGGGPWYIVDKDIQENLVYVAHASVVDQYSRRRFTLHQPNWIPSPPKDGSVQVKVRHSPVFASGRCYTTQVGDTLTTEVVLDTPDRGIAPGQFAVLYRLPYCLGSGRIRL